VQIDKFTIDAGAEGGLGEPRADGGGDVRGAEGRVELAG